MEKIKYAKKRFCVNVIKHGEDYTEGVMTDFEYPLTGVKRYYHTLFRLFDLRGCDRAFLDWLTEVMGSDTDLSYLLQSLVLFIRVQQFVRLLKGCAPRT